MALKNDMNITHFTHTELKEYEDSLKAYRDIKNSLDTAKDEGRAEGMAKGRVETLNKMVSKMKREGLGYDLIEKLTGLSQKDIDAIP